MQGMTWLEQKDELILGKQFDSTVVQGRTAFLRQQSPANPSKLQLTMEHSFGVTEGCRWHGAGDFGVIVDAMVLTTTTTRL